MNVEAEVLTLKEDMGGVKHDVNNLSGWQKEQNGSLLRIDKKIDDISHLINAKIDGINHWLIGLLGGVVISMLLLIINLVVKGGK